jgi:hypothetical protein
MDVSSLSANYVIIQARCTFCCVKKDTQDGFSAARNRNMLDHDDVPQYRGPTLRTTSKVTAPQTQSKTS